MPFSWKRPESIPIPQTWAKCKGKTQLADGSSLVYRIQDATPEMHEEIVDKLMMEHFLRDEILSKSIGMSQDPVSLREIREIWFETLKQNVGLVAVREYDDGREEIIATNVTCIASKEDKKDSDKLSGVAARKVIRLMDEDIPRRFDMFSHYGVDCYMSALGLSVLPHYRGQNIGVEMLRARFPMCRALGVRATGTAFTGIASQKQADRAGYELLLELPYREYKHGGEVVFPIVDTPSLKYMGKLIV